MPAMEMTLLRFAGFGIAARILIRRHLVLGFLVTLLLAQPVQAGSLTADLLVTNEPGTVFLRREQGESFAPSNVKTARRGEPVAAFILFSDCQPDDEGDCDVRVDMVVESPMGEVYGESRDAEVWTGSAPPSPGTIEIGVGYLMIRIEPDDPPGQYRIKAHIRDRIAGVALDREWAFDVAPLSPRDSPAWPADRPKPTLTGFWKDHCEDDFGLKIEPAGDELYSISFCGPGGCFDPDTYRPNSPIFGDDAYRVIDADTLEVLGGDGFSTYYRCPGSSAPRER